MKFLQPNSFKFFFWLAGMGNFTLALAAQQQAHQAGQSFASSLASTVTGAARSTSPRTVPGFQTDRPPEASLNAYGFGDKALAVSRTNPAAQHLKTQAAERQSFKIDPTTDPLFVEANRSILDPQKALSEKFTEIKKTSGQPKEETKTCLETGEEYTQRCSDKLHIVLTITPEIRNTVRYCPGHAKKARKGWSLHYSHWTEYCGGCATREDVTAKVVTIASEEWLRGCVVLEDLVAKGLCRYVSAEQSLSNETRLIQGEPITRDYFEKHFTYACFKAVPQTPSCASLRAGGCIQIKSVCQEKKGGQCILWLQTYRCSSSLSSVKTYGFSNSRNPFCLTGNCADASYEVNTELMTVMGQLSVLREAQKDLRDYKAIFKGNARKCTRNCLNFRDCCGSARGWGVSLGLSSCSKDEKELRILRDKNLCVQIGTYCAERDKILKTCLRKKTAFCCYGTRLARLIQESGHAQLGLGWGSAESPNCNGLSADQLSRLDFTRIDLSELFGDIRDKMVPKGQQQSMAQVSTERLQNNMTLLTRPSLDPLATRKQQALKGKGF